MVAVVGTGGEWTRVLVLTGMPSDAATTMASVETKTGLIKDSTINLLVIVTIIKVGAEGVGGDQIVGMATSAEPVMVTVVVTVAP